MASRPGCPTTYLLLKKKSIAMYHILRYWGITNYNSTFLQFTKMHSRYTLLHSVYLHCYTVYI